MIKQEKVIINNKEFIKTYSDNNMNIKQVETGNIYDEAIDVIPLRFTYVELDKTIEETIENEPPQLEA